MRTVDFHSDKAPGLWYVEDATGETGEYLNYDCGSLPENPFMQPGNGVNDMEKAKNGLIEVLYGSGLLLFYGIIVVK